MVDKHRLSSGKCWMPSVSCRSSTRSIIGAPLEPYYLYTSNTLFSELFAMRKIICMVWLFS